MWQIRRHLHTQETWRTGYGCLITASPNRGQRTAQEPRQRGQTPHRRGRQVPAKGTTAPAAAAWVHNSTAKAKPKTCARSWKGVAWMCRKGSGAAGTWSADPDGNELYFPYPTAPATRSEERRVGKECRSRWPWYHEKKK